MNQSGQHDPVTRQAVAGESGKGLSPMDPPDAKNPPAVVPVDQDAMHTFLRKFIDDHTELVREIEGFEETLASIPEQGYTRQIDQKLRHFFDYFEANFIPHSRLEEATIFPVIKQNLLKSGEHSPGLEYTTGVDVMEEDHIKAVQLAAITLNFLLLSFRLPDENSQLMVLDAALEQARNLIELLRMHIFREDNIIFGQAQRFISSEQFDRWQEHSGVS